MTCVRADETSIQPKHQYASGACFTSIFTEFFKRDLQRLLAVYLNTVKLPHYSDFTVITEMKAHRFGTNYFKCLMVLKMTSWKCTLDVLLAASRNSSFLIDGFHSNKAVTHMKVIKQPAHST